MPTEIPAKLKGIDINRFAHRAAQLEKVRPAVAYWCFYWIINQILSSGLHNADPECTAFSNTMMDKLEQMKEQYATEPKIADDGAGKSYVEEFGNETFLRADKAMGANNATRHTADTFQAAATFLELLQIWSPLGPDVASKVKYAKFHALRIAKAIKAGEDPNASNPKREPTTTAEEAAAEEQASAVVLDPDDPEVRQITGADQLQPSIEDTTDDHDQEQRSLAAQSTLNQSLHPSRASSIPRTQRHGGEEVVNDDAHKSRSDAEQQTTTSSSASRAGSVGGGYFPASSHTEAQSAQPPMFVHAQPATGLVSPPGPQNITPEAFYAQVPDPHATPNPQVTPMQHRSQENREKDQLATPTTTQIARPPAPTPTTAATAHHDPRQPQPYDMQADDLAVAEAQKHARWAISALNFEDVGTAVKELRLALASLGSS